MISRRYWSREPSSYVPRRVGEKPIRRSVMRRSLALTVTDDLWMVAPCPAPGSIVANAHRRRSAPDRRSSMDGAADPPPANSGQPGERLQDPGIERVIDEQRPAPNGLAVDESPVPGI